MDKTNCFQRNLRKVAAITWHQEFIASANCRCNQSFRSKAFCIWDLVLSNKINSDINTRFILSLEDLEIRKNQGKPGIIREFSMEIYPSQEEVKENKLFSLHIAFVNSCMVACKVVVRFVSVNLNFIS